MTPLMADQASGTGDSGRRSSVKARLTPNRRGRSVENDEFGAFARRILRAYSRRVGDGDVEALALMTGLADELDAAIAEAVKGLRKRGYSWAEIGSRVGVSRQGAQQRWGQRVMSIRAPEMPPDRHQQPLMIGNDSMWTPRSHGHRTSPQRTRTNS